MKVIIYFKKESPFGETITEMENITEIHYNYPSISNEDIMIAFESDIDQTGLTYKINYIREFEAK